MIFNVIAGNADAHGKNFSILYDAEGPRLAPLYDLLATVAYPDLSPKFAMKIGKRATLAELDAKGWAATAAAAFFSTVIAMGFFFAGIKIVGPGAAAVLSTIEPVVSIVVGVTALGESLNSVRVAGALMVLVSVTVLARLSGRTADEVAPRG